MRQSSRDNSRYTRDLCTYPLSQYSVLCCGWECSKRTCARLQSCFDDAPVILELFSLHACSRSVDCRKRETKMTEAYGEYTRDSSSDASILLCSSTTRNPKIDFPDTAETEKKSGSSRFTRVSQDEDILFWFGDGRTHGSPSFIQCPQSRHGLPN